MRENKPFEAWVDGVHFQLGVCPDTRTWYAHSSDRTYRFAGVADMADIVPPIRDLMALFTRPRLAA
jgi:hypothetical protein